MDESHWYNLETIYKTTCESEKKTFDTSCEKWKQVCLNRQKFLDDVNAMDNKLAKCTIDLENKKVLVEELQTKWLNCNVWADVEESWKKLQEAKAAYAKSSHESRLVTKEHLEILKIAEIKRKEWENDQYKWIQAKLSFQLSVQKCIRLFGERGNEKRAKMEREEKEQIRFQKEIISNEFKKFDELLQIDRGVTNHFYDGYTSWMDQWRDVDFMMNNVTEMRKKWSTLKDTEKYNKMDLNTHRMF